MLFSSLEFLLLFLPVTAVVYFLIPKRAEGARNIWLLVTSLFFYAWGEPRFVLIMIASVVINYHAARLVERYEKGDKRRRTVLVISVIFNLGLLFVFKYLNFTTGIINRIFDTFPITQIALPIGISFFTFQAMSYVIDVYRGFPAQKNICSLGLYISFFPQLIAGPIVRYTTVMEQITERTVTLNDISVGIKRFIIGFNKKLLLANILAEAADAAFASPELSVCMGWLGLLCYTFQIYFDFSAYSDMAIGLGRMFGFRFLENFNYPLTSKSVTEFWRRWHISLGTWFKDYLYIPLGGSRVKSAARKYFNIAVVWFLTGLWHGASFNYIFWGMLHGFAIILEKLTGTVKRSEKGGVWSFAGHIFTLFILMLGWTLFRAADLTQTGAYLKAVFGVGETAFIDLQFVFYIREYAVILFAALLCSTPLFRNLRERMLAAGARQAAFVSVLSWGVQTVLFAVSVSFLIMNSYNPFIYFNF